jgi:Lrp/AsnC family transcriptional regulator, leucine-responsive regulatory protein
MSPTIVKAVAKREGQNKGKRQKKTATSKANVEIVLRNKGAIDATSWALLRELQRDGRASLAELGRRVRLSAPAVSERLGRLEAAGVVTGYRAQVDLTRLGLPVTAFLRLTTSPDRQLTEVLGVLEGMPEVQECHRVTGNECFVLKVSLPSVTHLEHVIDRLRPYGQTVTSIVLSSPVTFREATPPWAQRRRG